MDLGNLSGAYCRHRRPQLVAHRAQSIGPERTPDYWWREHLSADAPGLERGDDEHCRDRGYRTTEVCSERRRWCTGSGDQAAHGGSSLIRSWSQVVVGSSVDSGPRSPRHRTAVTSLEPCSTNHDSPSMGSGMYDTICVILMYVSDSEH